MSNTPKNQIPSGHKGVVWCKANSKWHAQIWNLGKNYHVGYFDTIEEAAKARAGVIERCVFRSGLGGWASVVAEVNGISRRNK